MVEFKIFWAARGAQSKLVMLYFGRQDFGLYRDLLGRVPWDRALEGREAQERGSDIQGSSPLSSGPVAINGGEADPLNDEQNPPVIQYSYERYSSPPLVVVAGPPMDLLQKVHILLMLGNPELDTVFWMAS
ncbi:hypothetical protein BTVI_09807 [Pitangus sulphuratus]|nr:hypothetical protein BTVI_09807 [Pitangus sulphuratus]